MDSTYIRTAMRLGYLEYRAREQRNRRQGELPLERQARREKRLAGYLWPPPRRK
jgi:hypothetical protein